MSEREREKMLNKMSKNDDQNNPKYMGRTTAQIMMKNPIIKGIRKQLFRSTKIKMLAATNK